MSFGQFLSILQARWWVAALVLILTVATTLAVSLKLPKQYSASASVLVDVKPDPVSAVMYGGMMSPGFMATQVDIIKSDRVAQRVVANLKLADNPQIRQQWLDATKGEGRIEVWLADTFQKSMDVVPSRESSVINVSYRAQDPRFAAGLANAFVQAYIETSLQLRVDPARQYSSFFETRSKEAREALEKAQVKVSAFQSANGIIANDERLDVENARLNELSSQYTMVQALAAESRSRQTAAQSGQGDRLQEVLSNGIVSQLKADLNRNEARLKELSTRLGDAHPQVEEIRASIVELKLRLEAETRKVTGGVSMSNTINVQRAAEIKASLESQRAKVLKMKTVRDEGSVLLRDVENAQRSYDAVLQRFTQTSLEGQTTQSNVNLLQQASEPSQPSSPKVALNTGLSVLLGSLLSLVSVFLLELRDRRVRSVEDVVLALELPVLGVMPKPGSRLTVGRKRLSTMQQRLLAPAVVTAKSARLQ
jgi:polysaccharide biosynthesis transport protein